MRNVCRWTASATEPRQPSPAACSSSQNPMASIWDANRSTETTPDICYSHRLLYWKIRVALVFLDWIKWHTLDTTVNVSARNIATIYGLSNDPNTGSGFIWHGRSSSETGRSPKSCKKRAKQHRSAVIQKIYDRQFIKKTSGYVLDGVSGAISQRDSAKDSWYPDRHFDWGYFCFVGTRCACSLPFVCAKMEGS